MTRKPKSRGCPECQKTEADGAKGELHERHGS
jgi:hypothetical protein